MKPFLTSCWTFIAQWSVCENESKLKLIFHNNTFSYRFKPYIFFVGHLIKSAVKRRPRVCISTWAFRGYFLVDLLFDFYLVHKLFNTVVSHCKAEPIHVEEKSRQKKSQKKGLKTVGKKNCKNSHEKKGNVKTVAKKRDRKKSREKKRLYIVTRKRVHLQALRCAPVSSFPGGALTIHQAHAPTGFTNKFHSVPSRIREICFGVRGSSIIWIWTMANVLSRGRSCC